MIYKDINLQQEVYRQDVYKLMDWLRDEEVSRYLNEEKGIINSLDYLLRASTLPILTPYFNQGGPFYIIEYKKDSVGYLKLVPKGKIVEIVIAIGNREKWGQGIGSIALKKGISEAFLSYKANEIVAKIHHNNIRSKKIFRKAGFTIEDTLEVENLYSLTFDDYINGYSKERIS